MSDPSKAGENIPLSLTDDGTVCDVCKRTAETRELHFHGREHVSRMFVCLACWVKDFAPMIWQESQLLPPPGGLPPSDETPPQEKP